MLYALVVGLCAGTATGLLARPGSAVCTALLAASVILITRSGKNRRRLLLAGAFAAAAALGIVRADMFLADIAKENVLSFAGGQALIEGAIVDDPDRRDSSTRIAIDATRINGQPARGTLLAEVPRDSRVAYGDRVVVRGILQAPQAFEASGGRQFDYPGYLRAHGIAALMYRAALLENERGDWSVQSTLFSMRHRFEAALERMLPEPDVSLLEGILLGQKHGIPDELNQAFIVSGLVHVVVLSGFNIAIVADAAMRAFSFLPRTLGFSLGGISMLLFVLMTGGGATAVRACIMAGIAILARFLGRPAAAMRALAVALGAMILWNPSSLLYDPSFILSMLATFGLVTLGSGADSLLARLPLPRAAWSTAARGIAATTLAVQAFVLPALLFFTGVLSFVSLPANIIALPVVPYAMYSGFFAGLLGLAHPFIGIPIALISDALLKWMMFVATSAAALPWSSVIIPAFPAWIAILVYIPIFAFALWIYASSTKSREVSS